MKLLNLARMSTATTGTGTITLGSAKSGYLSFAGAGALDGDILEYAISDGTASEIGYGTYTASGTTLTRNVTKSTNSNSAINLSGSAEVFVSPRAEMLIGGDGRVITPEMYGANGDVVVNTSGGAITSGTNSFTQSGYTFISSDAGKTIAIDGAGSAGATLVTTISSVSAGAAILAVNASTTVSSAANEWGTNDTTALNNMAAASGGKAVWFAPGKRYYYGGSNQFRFGSDKFVIYGNQAEVRLMPNASSTTMGLIMADSTWLASGPSYWAVYDLRFYGNRTRRISSGAITNAVHSAPMLYIIGCFHFHVQGCYAEQTDSDGYYVGGGHSGGRLSNYGTFYGCHIRDAGRNGYSVVGANYVIFDSCSAENINFGSSHTNISYGWDLEPDASASSNQAIHMKGCIASNCSTTGFGSNIANGTNTVCVAGHCYAEACGVGFYESAAGTFKVYACTYAGNTTNFTNVSEKISGF